MRQPTLLVVAALAAFAVSPARSDTITRTLAGSADGRTVAAALTIDFTATGGAFELGTGAATVHFTVENACGLIPFQNPPTGNFVLTGFSFNLPAGATMRYASATVLADGVIHSIGADVGGERLEPGTERLANDRDVTSWFTADLHAPAGALGIFGCAIETGRGASGALADPGLFDAAGLPLGDAHPPVVVAGAIRFTVELSNLDTSFASADDFLEQCTALRGGRAASSLGAHFESSGPHGITRASVTEACLATPARPSSWGALKTRFR